MRCWQLPMRPSHAVRDLAVLLQIGKEERRQLNEVLNLMALLYTEIAVLEQMEIK